MSKNYKIVHVLPFYEPVLGGMEALVKNIAELQVQTGHQVDILTVNEDHQRRVLDRPNPELINGVNVFRFKSLINIGFISLFPGISKILKTKEYDVIHVHSYRHPHTEIAVSIGRNRGIPTILHGHGPFYSDSISKPKKMLYSLYDHIARFTVLKNSDAFIAFTNLEKTEYIKRGAATDKVHVIRNGIPDSYFNFDVDSNIRFKYSLEGKKVILFAGRLHPNKRVDHLIEVLPDILEKCPDAFLALVGPGQDYYEKLKTIIDRKNLFDRVKWLGKVSSDDLISLYETADCFVMPSDYEPFGLVLVEAMSQGTPVIAVNNAGPKEIVNNGYSGLLYDQGDLEGLKSAILKILGNRDFSEELGKHALERAQELTLSAMVKKIDSLYEELVSEKTR